MASGCSSMRIDSKRIAVACTTGTPAKPTAKKAAPKSRKSSYDVSDGVLLGCVSVKGKLKVRVLSHGYRRDWFVQFPRDIRQKGGLYSVDQVVEAKQGDFYRVVGKIRKLN